MKPYTRSDRVGELIKQVLSDLLSKEVKDPRLRAATITSVKMTKDLRIAKIYFCTNENKRIKDDAVRAFKSAQGYIKRILSQNLELRYMPDLKFFYDDSIDYGAHIEKVLTSIRSNNESNYQSTEKK